MDKVDDSRVPLTDNARRAFHVKGQGWYFEAREGLQGPYIFREHAELHLQTLMGRGQKRAALWTDKERESELEAKALSGLLGALAVRRLAE